MSLPAVRPRWRLAAAATVLLVLAAAGCRGAEDPQTVPTPSASAEPTTGGTPTSEVPDPAPPEEVPLLINSGVGDSDGLIEQFQVGTSISEFNAESYRRVASEIMRLTAQPEIRERTRAVARQLFDLQTVGAKRYAELYERVLGYTN